MIKRSHEQLVREAKVIVRARAEGLGTGPESPGLFSVPTQVRFRVLAIYKGALPGATLEFNGSLEPAESRDRPVGYDFKQPRSFTPSCVNTSYRAGAEYLLLLGADGGLYARAGELTPYWGAHEPTNERVVGDRDPWLTWVVRRLRRQPRF